MIEGLSGFVDDNNKLTNGETLPETFARAK